MLEAIIIGVIILIAAVILGLILASAIRSIRGSKKNTEEKVEDLKDGSVQSQEVTKKEVVTESMKFVIGVGESEVVGSEGRIPCGEYIMESADGQETFNVRIGRYVREYKNGTKVVLTEKQKITPVSSSIVLR